MQSFSVRECSESVCDALCLHLTRKGFDRSPKLNRGAQLASRHSVGNAINVYLISVCQHSLPF